MSRGSYLAATILALGLLWSCRPASAFAQADAPAADSGSEVLRVATKEIEPFVFIGDELREFSIDLWQQLARVSGLEYEYVVVEMVTEQLDAVTRSEADAAIAAISITQTREEAVDFSFSYFNAGLGILVRNTDTTPALTALRSGEFTLTLLRLFGLLVFVIVVAGHVIWLLEQRRNEISRVIIYTASGKGSDGRPSRSRPSAMGTKRRGAFSIASSACFGFLPVSSSSPTSRPASPHN